MVLRYYFNTEHEQASETGETKKHKNFEGCSHCKVFCAHVFLKALLRFSCTPLCSSTDKHRQSLWTLLFISNFTQEPRVIGSLKIGEYLNRKEMT